ncbi:MAG: hypothetical protein K940chlam3_00005 [Chlamydiae bacterium]|nr:hypothetical protein [Chlamydiota bacterium]
MSTDTIVLFGESERGDYRIPYYCRSMHQLYENLGQPAPDSEGIHFAVQALLHDFYLIFFRVKEEGYSYQDYYEGFWQLEQRPLESRLSAICIPGVGNCEVIESVSSLCVNHRSILIMSESDFYDYLTDAA